MARGIFERHCPDSRLALVCLSLLWNCGTHSTTTRGGESPDRAGLDFFESKVRPVLVTPVPGLPRPRQAEGRIAAGPPRPAPEGRGHGAGHRARTSRKIASWSAPWGMPMT